MATNRTSWTHPSLPRSSRPSIKKALRSLRQLWCALGEGVEGYRAKVLFTIKHKNREVALVFLVETIIGCFHTLKPGRPRTCLEAYTSGLFQLQKAARETRKTWSQTGPPKGLGLSFETQANSQVSSAQFNSHLMIRKGMWPWELEGSRSLCVKPCAGLWGFK